MNKGQIDGGKKNQIKIPCLSITHLTERIWKHNMLLVMIIRSMRTKEIEIKIIILIDIIINEHGTMDNIIEEFNKMVGILGSLMG